MKGIENFVSHIGSELEIWLRYREKELPKVSVFGGAVKCEASPDMCEGVTEPRQSVVESVGILREMLRQIGKTNVILTSRRPAYLVNDSEDYWSNAERYNQLREKLAEEAVPSFAHLIDAMVHNCSFQLSMSGFFDPRVAGVFLINIFNNMFPYFAQVIHREVGQGYGHLAVWQKFAGAGRLPDPNRWPADFDAMAEFISRIPRILSADGGVVPAGQMMSVDCPLDLSTLWWHVRFKISPAGVPYIEFRGMPSMSLEHCQKFGQMLVDAVNVLLTWFYGANKGRPVSTLREARPAFEFLADCFRGTAYQGYFPDRPQTEEEWRGSILK